MNFKFNKYFHHVKCQNTWLHQICQDGPHLLASKVEATFTSIFMGNIRVGRPLFKFIHLLKASQWTLRSIETLSFKRWVSLYYWSRANSNQFLVAITKLFISVWYTFADCSRKVAVAQGPWACSRASHRGGHGQQRGWPQRAWSRPYFRARVRLVGDIFFYFRNYWINVRKETLALSTIDWCSV